MQIKSSNKLSDITEVNRISTESKSEICILELSSLGHIIPYSEAEDMRQDWLDRGTQVRQLTNSEHFGPWTSVEGFVTGCMSVKYLPNGVLPINFETLIFDDVVAIYQVKPVVTLFTFRDWGFADQQRAAFELLWQAATPMKLNSEGATI